MADIDSGEAGTILKVLMECARYPRIKTRPALMSELNNASQILKSKLSKQPQQPTGGASVRIISDCDKQKINELWGMFHLK